MADIHNEAWWGDDFLKVCFDRNCPKCAPLIVRQLQLLKLNGETELLEKRERQYGKQEETQEAEKEAA